MVQIHFLILEDSLLDTELLVASLADYGAALSCYSRTEPVLKIEDVEQFTAAFINLKIGEDTMAGIPVIRHLRSRSEDIPIIVISGADDEEMKDLALRAGANEFFVKDFHGLDKIKVKRLIELRFAALNKGFATGKLQRLKDPKVWFLGLVAGAVGAFWGAVESALVLPAIDNHTFNYGEGLSKMIKGVCIFGALSAIKFVAAYLKKSPLPPLEGEDTQMFRRSDFDKR